MKNVKFLSIIWALISMTSLSLSAQNSTANNDNAAVYNVRIGSPKLPFKNYNSRYFTEKGNPAKNEAYQHFKLDVSGYYRLASNQLGVEASLGFEPYPNGKNAPIISFETSVRVRFNKEELTKGYEFNSLSGHAVAGINLFKERPNTLCKKSPMYLTLAYVVGVKHYEDWSIYDVTKEMSPNGIGTYDTGWTFEHGPYAAVNIRLFKMGKTAGSNWVYGKIFGEYLSSNMIQYDRPTIDKLINGPSTDFEIPNGKDERRTPSITIGVGLSYRF